ncbi:MAG: hypothetical protein M1821_006557 [Bathelium mastoideum]|nr:MAG: hypothetical protein M1821_006557 [Bathelium mastoideum]
MYRRSDPRIRRTLNQLSQNLESANESAQANLYNVTQTYISPCLSSVAASLTYCAESACPCVPILNRDERLRQRRRQRPRGRAEASFDFYDDWEEDETDGLLGWGTDELDRLLAGTGSNHTSQPGRPRAMSYGSRRDAAIYPGGRRRSAVPPHDGGPDPTIIPNTSFLGFLGRWPWKVGSKGLRYKPSAADLQEHPGQSRRAEHEVEPLIEDSEEGETTRGKKGRKRSGTANSGHTTDSLSSRGDIFPSDGEDDAVPLDDEFAMVLERRTTNQSTHDEGSSGRTRKSSRPSNSRISTRTGSSRSLQTSSKKKSRPFDSIKRAESDVSVVPSLAELKQEEDLVRHEEEGDVQRRREAAERLALQRGLASPEEADLKSPAMTSAMTSPAVESIRSQVFSPDSTISPTPGSNTPSTRDDAPEPEEPADESTSISRENEELEQRQNEHPPSGFVPAQLPHFSKDTG